MAKKKKYNEETVDIEEGVEIVPEPAVEEKPIEVVIPDVEKEKKVKVPEVKKEVKEAKLKSKAKSNYEIRMGL